MLTNEQIEYLFDFCTTNGVKYYDVQIELVDHLANAVEEEITSDPKITFENALEKVHRSFGYRGFEPLVAEKQKFAKKQSRRLYWKLFREHFQWPKIIIFLLMSAIFFTVFSAEIFSIKLIFGLVMIMYFGNLLFGLLLERIVAQTGKKFLIINFDLNLRLLNLPVSFLLLFKGVTERNFLDIVPTHILIPGMSIFLSFYIIALIASWQTISSIKKELYQTYPEVFSLVN